MSTCDSEGFQILPLSDQLVAMATNFVDLKKLHKNRYCSIWLLCKFIQLR